MKRKKLWLALTLVLLLLAMTGCSIPVDENGKFILITLDTTFGDMMNNEGFFAALFVYPLSQFINFVTPYTNVGIAILIVTLVINSIVLVFTFKSQIQMQKLQMIQPEMDKILRKYEGRDDQASKMRMAQEMQNLYSKYKVNPMGSLLSNFIQFPILIAMYHAVQRAEAVATGTFMGVSLEVTPWDGFKNGEWIYVAFFGLMLVAQVSSVFIPQYLAKRRAKKEAEKHHKPYHPAKNPMGNSMYFMMIIIFVLMINWPTAMSFYYMISSLVQIVKAFVVEYMMDKKGA